MPNLYQGDSGPVQYFPPPPPLRANPGPPARGSYAGSRSSAGTHPVPPPKPPPDIFAGYLGPAVDAAKQLVQQWMALMDYPSGMDANQLTLDILQQGLAGDAQGADAWLSQNAASIDQQQSHMWAQYGLDPTTYQTRKDSLDSTFKTLIGQTGDWRAGWTIQSDPANRDLNNIYQLALKGNWNQTQILQALTGSTNAQVQSIVAAQPWLASGQTFQQTSQSFASLYGAAPVDTSTLASWFKFNAGATQINRSGREAIESAAPAPQAATTTR